MYKNIQTQKFFNAIGNQCFFNRVIFLMKRKNVATAKVLLLRFLTFSTGANAVM
jgi:hypothetical protein